MVAPPMNEIEKAAQLVLDAALESVDISGVKMEKVVRQVSAAGALFDEAK